MKTLYGSALAGPSDERELIERPPLGRGHPQRHQPRARTALICIIRPRIVEIFELVRDRLEVSGYNELGGRRAVLTGGASQMQGVAEVAAQVLEKQVRLGRPIEIDGLAESTAGPAFATATGLLKYAASGLAGRDVGAMAQAKGRTGGLARIGHWLRENF